MQRKSFRRWVAIPVVLLVAAVWSSAAHAATDSHAAVQAATGIAAPSKWPTTSTGVTKDEIKIGFTYLDLEALAKTGLVKTSWGPTEDIVNALVDDINAKGGVNGRKLKVSFAKYLPVGNEQSLAACTKLTQDDGVFAVLTGFLADNNLCVTQQHSTVLISALGSVDRGQLAKARAPWASIPPTDERGIDAVVRLADENKLLKGHTFGIYTTPDHQTTADTAKAALKAAGYKVVDTAVLDAPLTDRQAVAAQDKVIAQRMMDEKIDTVFDVTNFVPAADFDAAGFHPRLFSQFADTFLAAAATNPLDTFPLVAGIAAYDPEEKAFNSPEMKACRDAYTKATGKTILGGLEESRTGNSTGNPSLGLACNQLYVFVKAAKAAGKDLNQRTFAQGLIKLGNFTLPDTTPASFGPDKPDATNRFQLVKLDPTYEPNSGQQPYIAIGSPLITTK